jgi:hypothetical protein
MKDKTDSYLPKFKIGGMFEQIDRKIRSRKTISLALAALVTGATLHLNSMMARTSTHYVKTVGSCKQQTTIKIFDETGGADFTAIESSNRWTKDTYQIEHENTIENEHFKKYVRTISKYIFASVDAMGQCQGTSGQPQVELVFVYRPTISGGITPFDFQPHQSPGTKQLNSPWAKLALDKSTDLKLQAVFIWNERQFLFDQLVRCGWPDIDRKPLLPIDLKTFDRWQRDEAHHWTPADYFKQLPVDIVLLFTSNRRMTLVPHEPEERQPMENLKSKARVDKIGYTDLNEALIDRLFDSTQKEIRYDSILDLKDVLKTDKYGMNPYIGACEEDSKSWIQRLIRDSRKVK